jgi:hypothetical protein
MSIFERNVCLPSQGNVALPAVQAIKGGARQRLMPLVPTQLPGTQLRILFLLLHLDRYLCHRCRSMISDERFGISRNSLLPYIVNFVEDDLASILLLWLHQVASLRRDMVERALLGVILLHCTIWMDIQPR